MPASKLLIKNMVCPRCVSAVSEIFARNKLAVERVELGEVELSRAISEKQKKQLAEDLKKAGFELIETRQSAIIEKIKGLVHDYVNAGAEKKYTLSAAITKAIPNDYSYLSDLFSSVEGMTIEQYFIRTRIEKVKELLVYGQLSLTEIAWQTGFSSVHHLSSQFKKVTGLTPTYFRSIGARKREAIGK